MNDKHLRVWFVVFVVAVFLAGVGGGMMFDRFFGPPPRRAPVMTNRGAAGFAFGPEAPMVMRRLVRDLNLTSDQQAQLDKIFADGRQRLQQTQSEVRARFEDQQKQLREAIEKILTPDQRKRFEDWLAREPLPGIRRPGRGPGWGGGPGRGMGPGRGPGQ